MKNYVALGLIAAYSGMLVAGSPAFADHDERRAIKDSEKAQDALTNLQYNNPRPLVTLWKEMLTEPKDTPIVQRTKRERPTAINRKRLNTLKKLISF